MKNSSKCFKCSTVLRTRSERVCQICVTMFDLDFETSSKGLSWLLVAEEDAVGSKKFERVVLPIITFWFRSRS